VCFFPCGEKKTKRRRGTIITASSSQHGVVVDVVVRSFVHVLGMNEE